MSVEIAWKQNILVTDFHLLKSQLVVFGFGWQAFVCGFSRQNINSVYCVAIVEQLTNFMFTIEKNNNTRTVQAESSKFASLSFDQRFQIVIPPRIVSNVPEPIGTPSDGILH